MNSLLNLNNFKPKQNSFSMNFETNQIVQTEIKFDKDTIKNCSEILSRYLIDYIKKGGDTNHLTPNNLFKR